MNWLKELWRRLKYLRQREQMDADLAEEMRLHLELRALQQAAGRNASADAQSAAQREFGNVTRLREKSRDVWGWGWLDSLAQDLKYGFRNLMASRGFTLTAVLSLALGIGANTAIFSIINAVMLRSLPVPDPHRLVKFARDGGDSLTNPLWEAIRDHQNACSGTFAYSSERFDLAQEGEKQLVNGMYVSGDFFNVLKVPAYRGRLFTNDDDIRGGGRSGSVAVISHAFWETHYGSEPSAIGKTIYLNGNPFEIIGIVPPNFTGLEVERTFGVAIPLCNEPQFNRDRSALDNRSWWWLRVGGRLLPDVSAEQASERLKTVAPEIMRITTPGDWDKNGQEGYARAGLTIDSISNGISGMSRENRTALFAIMGVVVMVLLIACANIANLLLARAAARQQEISVRMSIGAGRRRLIRQLLTESLLLAALGIPFGLLLAKWGSRLFISMMSSGRNRLEIDTGMDARVLLFTIGISTLTGLIFGLAPALRATRISTNEILKQTTRGARPGGTRFRLGKALVAGQVALSLALLVGAGLFIGTLRNLLNVPLGFNQQNVLAIQSDLHAKVPKEQRLDRFASLVEKIQQVPGVVSVSMSMITPVSGQGWNGNLYPAGKENPPGERRPQDICWYNRVGPRFFETMQIPLVMGREFDANDRVTSSKVIILGEKTARDFFGAESPIGKRVSMHGPGGSFDKYEIVGIARDTKYREIREQTRRTAFVPTMQDANPGDRPNFIARVQGSLDGISPALRAVMIETSPGISIEIGQLEGMIRDTLSQQRLVAGLVSFFGALALLLAVIGLYGVTSYGAARRQGEIGIRMALGAQRASVVWLIIRDVAVILTIGSLIGIALSLGAGKMVGSLMFGIEANDLKTFAVSAILLMIAGGIAGLLPALKASRLDPAVALRCE